MQSMDAVRETSQAQFRVFYRFGKSMFSSSYEKLFLQATRPDDEPVAQEHVDSLLESVAQFRTLGDTEEEDNPYRVTLRKIWSKLMERDYRTVIKALYLLHRIVRDSHPRDGAIFDRHLRRMQREINPKAKPPRTYFNLAQVVDLAPESEPYRTFVGAFAVYVLKRATTFTGRFEQVRSLSAGQKESEVLATMRAARACLNYALRCSLEADLENYVTCTALELLARDLRDLWKGYCVGVNCLLEADGAGLSPSLRKEKVKILEAFKEDRTNVKQFMRKTSRALAYYRLRVPADLETKVDMAAVAAAVTAVKAGKAPPSSRRPAVVEEDDEEELEDEREVEMEEVEAEEPEDMEDAYGEDEDEDDQGPRGALGDGFDDDEDGDYAEEDGFEPAAFAEDDVVDDMDEEDAYGDELDDEDELLPDEAMGDFDEDDDEEYDDFDDFDDFDDDDEEDYDDDWD